MNRRWYQCICAECKHINFLPFHGIDPLTIPCAHCGEVALTTLENASRIEMPKFRASSKPQPSSNA